MTPTANLYPLNFPTIDPTWEVVTAHLTAATDKAPAGATISGEIGPCALDDPSCNLESLDNLVPLHPVRLSTFSGHAAVLNTQGFSALGIEEDTPDPAGGRFERSNNGARTGVVREYAWFALQRRIGEAAPDAEGLWEVRGFLNEAARMGVTTTQCMPLNRFEQFVSWCERAPAPIRIRAIPLPMTSPHGLDRSEATALRDHVTSLITVSGTKWVLDGSPIECSQAMRAPYTDNPGTRGILNFGVDEIEAMLREALEDGEQPLFHAAGDRAVEALLDAMDATGGMEVWRFRRVRMEHGDGIMPDLLPRVRELGLVVVQNPSHFSFRDLFIKRYGAERTQQLEPLRSLLNAGNTYSARI